MSDKPERTNLSAKPLWLSALLLALPALSQAQNSNWEKSVIDDLMDFQHKNRYSSRIIEPMLVEYGPCYLLTDIQFTVQDGQPTNISVQPAVPHETLVKYWHYIIKAAAPYPAGSGTIEFTSRADIQRYDSNEIPGTACGAAR